MNGGMVASGIGGLLCVVGIALVIAQFVRESRRRGAAHGATRSISAEAGWIKFSVSTTFPGLILAGLGTVLLVVGAFVWR